MLGRSSFYFLKGKNIFLISQFSQILRLSLKNFKSNDESMPLFYTRKSIEIKLKTEIIIENKEEKEENTLFIEKQLIIITQAFNSLNKEIISDDTSLSDFINVIKSVAFKEKNNNESIFKLQIPSDNCVYWMY